MAAPVLLAGYGLVRLTDPRHRPGLVWTVGHVLMLASLVCFGVVVAGLRRTRPGWFAGAGAVVAYAGLVALVVQAVLDIAVGVFAGDVAAKRSDFALIQAVPLVRPVVYTAVPVLFYLGLLVLVIWAAARRGRLVRWWAPVLVLVGTIVSAYSLDYLPVAGLLYLVGLLPVGWPAHRPASVAG